MDAEPTPAERAAAEALIAMERSTIPDDPHHALLPPPINPHFSAVIQSELDRIAASPDPNKPAPLRAIDLGRYEAPDIDTTGTATGARRDELEPALAQAYTAMSYLSARRQHLALLDNYGKNAWLVGNWQLDAELRAVERELAETRRAIDVLTVRRQRTQQESGSEIKGLDEAWRRGVGRVLEAEVAAEGVRREVIEAQRARA